MKKAKAMKAQKQMTTEQIQDRTNREMACIGEISELLKKHNCKIEGALTFVFDNLAKDSQMRIDRQVRITAL